MSALAVVSEVPSLVRYEAACRALAEAKSVDEVLYVRDVSDRMKLVARQAKNRDMEIDATEIRLRAEHKLGRIIQMQKETVGLNKGVRMNGRDIGGAVVEPPKDVPKLADAGIDKKLSSRAQKAARIPDEKFNADIAEWRAKQERETGKIVASFIKKAKQASIVREAVTFDGCNITDLNALVAEGRKFGAIYADPPWLYDNQGTRAATGNHYNGMTVDEICALPIRELAADNSHLHLWTTNGFLFDCPKIFEAWGFEFRSSFVWVKPQMGIGNYWRNSHEILLTAIRGDAKRFNDKSLKSWIECDRGRHSAKPEQVRSFIERASTGPYLELFGRRAAKNWTVWGNQIERSLFNSAAPMDEAA